MQLKPSTKAVNDLILICISDDESEDVPVVTMTKDEYLYSLNAPFVAQIP